MVTAPIQMASYLPGGVVPEFVKDTNVASTGEISNQDGALYYQPATKKDGVYIFGHNRVAWVDWIGALFFMGVLLAVSVHAAMRYISALRHPKATGRSRKFICTMFTSVSGTGCKPSPLSCCYSQA